MKCKEITVSIKQIKNLGNYQNVAVEASITLVLDESEKSSEAYEKGWTSVKGEVEKQIAMYGGK